MFGSIINEDKIIVQCTVLYVCLKASIRRAALETWYCIVVVCAFVVVQFCVAWFTPVKIVLPIQIDQLLVVASAHFGLTN